ncbi:hypothetical protein N7534_004412 [Penicillium rubens]|jgi:hypothetical protein|nr:hypothetical protein N7524_000761 [Penicillium chrysogenum]KAJ5859135.1 hypothetical protein N7534_004412 [Penicillium rubens]
MQAHGVGMITMIALGKAIPPYIAFDNRHYRYQASMNSFLGIRYLSHSAWRREWNPITERMVIEEV